MREGRGKLGTCLFFVKAPMYHIKAVYAVRSYMDSAKT